MLRVIRETPAECLTVEDGETEYLKKAFDRFIDRFGINQNFSRLWLASVVSNLGDGVLEAAAPLLVASLTRDPAAVAGMTTAAMLPWLIFPLLSGALADRWDRRLTMIAANLFRACVVGAVGIGIWAGGITVWVLYAAVFVLGAAQTLFDTTSQSILPAVVDRKELEKANGRLYAAEMVTNSFAGKPLGGLLYSVAPAVPFLFNTVSRAVATIQIVALGGSFAPDRDADHKVRSIFRDILEGVTWLWNHRLLRTLAFMVGIMNLCSSAAYATFVLFAQDILGLGDVGFGMLLTAGALGGLAGTVVADKMVSRLGPGTSILVSVLLGPVTYAIIGLTGSVFVVGLASALGAAGGVVWNVVTVSFRQSIIPDGLLGRVNSVYRLLAWGTMPLGATLGGLLARGYGLRAPFWFAVSLEALMFLLGVRSVNNRAIKAARGEVER